MRARSVVVTAAIAVSVGTGVLLSSGTAYAAVDTTPPIRVIGGSSTGLSLLDGLAVGPDGSLYATNNAAIDVFAPGASGDVAPTRVIAGSNTGLSYPYGLAFDSAGNVYVADYRANAIYEFAAGASGNVAPIRTISGESTTMFDPVGIALNAAGDIYVTEQAGIILEFASTANGNVAPIRVIQGAATTLDFPCGIQLDKDGNIYVSNNGNDSDVPSVTVFASTATGNAAPIRVIAGSATSLNVPYYLLLDGGGNVFVANFLGNTITIYGPDQSGNATPLRTISGPTTQINAPFPIAMDAQGNLYVGNYGDDTIAVFAPGSSISSISPKSGPVSGGTAITVTGSGFGAEPVVTVDGVAATDVTVVSATEITAVTPAHAAGEADVRVISGGSTAIDPGGFTYLNVLALTGFDAGPSTVLALGLLATGALLILGRTLLVRRRRGLQG